MIEVFVCCESLPVPTGVSLKPDKKQDNSWYMLRRYANLGIEMVVSVLIGAWGGNSLDKWLGTRPWLLLLGFIFGAAAGFLNMARLIAATEKNRNKEKNKA